MRTVSLFSQCSQPVPEIDEASLRGFEAVDAMIDEFRLLGIIEIYMGCLILTPGRFGLLGKPGQFIHRRPFALAPD